jgi:hypothetical protein
MIYLAIATWLIFVGASAWGYQWHRRKSLEGLNRHYVDVVDDTFLSINTTLGRIERGQADLLRSFIALTTAMLDLGKSVPPVGDFLKQIKERDVPVIENPSPTKFITSMEYVRDKFATSPVQKKVIETIINNIKKQYDGSNSASAA